MKLFSTFFALSQAKNYDGYAQLKLENISKLKLGLVERILAQLECLNMFENYFECSNQ